MVVHDKGSLYVQQATLVKLLCTKCKKYLSYPPIYRHAVEGPVCGRCPVDNTTGFTRDEVYEQAIEYQKFPCINYESGCLENLFPCRVAEHEKICAYMKLDCPTRVYNNCTWQGAVSNVLNHFENKHPTFILQDGQFEVDFVNNHKENYIMTFAENIYVVTREANPKEKTFAVNVSCLGTDSDAKKYIYSLTLEVGNKVFKYSLFEQVGTQLELQSQIVQEMLHHPVSIIAKINIQEFSIDGSTQSDAETDDTPNSLVNYKQIEKFKCPVCFWYMLPPIYQCAVGHSICTTGDCKKIPETCPTCRGAIGKTRNFILEDIINDDDMIYPCRHSGCRFATKARDIRKHEETCLCGPFKCPLEEYEKCTDTFPGSHLFKHINSNHYESLVELDTISVPIDHTLKEDIDEGYILKHGLLFFKLCFKYDHNKKILYWAVQLVGPAEESTKYKFELEIIDNHERNNRIYIKMNCSPLALKVNTFNNEDYVCFEYSLISRFIKNQLTYRIRIVPNK